jgi:transcriptional regulator with XRE-family HTH domain
MAYGIICGVKGKHNDIEKQLKKAIVESKMSQYRICKEAGLSESQLSYFVNGKRSLTLPAAAKLAKALGLELTRKKAR